MHSCFCLDILKWTPVLLRVENITRETSSSGYPCDLRQGIWPHWVSPAFFPRLSEGKILFVKALLKTKLLYNYLFMNPKWSLPGAWQYWKPENWSHFSLVVHRLRSPILSSRQGSEMMRKISTFFKVIRSNTSVWNLPHPLPSPRQKMRDCNTQ